VERLRQLRAIMAEEELDGFMVTSSENRRYFSGFTGSSGVLLIDANRAILLTDFRYLEQAQTETKDCGITVQEHQAVIWKSVASFFNEQKIVGRKQRWGFESANLTVEDYHYLQDEATGVQLIAQANLLNTLRSVKSEAEIKAIEKAVTVTDQAWKKVLPQIKPGLKETEVAALFEYEQRRLGADQTSFQTIVASGPKSAMPHATAGARLLQAGDLLVLDGGAVVNGYCSDFTRTIVVGGELREVKQQMIYDLVLTAQEEAIERLKPGMTGKEGDNLGRKIIAEAGYGDNFGHGLGHSLGLAIHEEPRLSPREEKVLQPGMVFTVEPGIYLPGWGGVRIEDVIVVTADGCRNLTGSAKKLIPR